MNERIGTCSLCGGDVYGYVGAWWGTVPPPPPTCSGCGAVARADDTIEMTRRTYPRATRSETSTTWTLDGNG